MKKIYGHGINDADYKTQTYSRVDGKRVVGFKCPYYIRWKEMLRRCYSEKWIDKFPRYRGCSVSQEWLLFSNFKRWMELQNWEGMQLDKDLLIEGNKIYSSSTCIFVSQEVNKFLTLSDSKRGEYPLGVHFSKRDNKFISQCSQLNGKQKTIGYFDNPEEAHAAWRVEKKRLSICLANSQTDDIVRNALLNFDAGNRK